MTVKKIPRHSTALSNKDLKIVLKSILSGNIIEGEKIKEFEGKFAKYIGVKHAITVSSARMGIYLSIKSLDIKKNDEIILPSYNFHIIPSIIVSLGAKPVFVDIDPKTYNINPEKIEEKITKKTKALLIVHLFGNPCNMKHILKICKKYNLILIEDCAHACGGEYKGKKVGNFGNLGCFSFSIAKNMTALSGGVVTTNNNKVAKKIRNSIESFEYPNKLNILKIITKSILISFMSNPKVFSEFTYPMIRFLKIFKFDINDIFEEDIKLIKKIPKKHKTKFTNLQASIAIKQLEKLDSMNEKRIENAKEISKFLKEIKSITVPKTLTESKHVYHKYVITVDSRKRDSIVKKLFDRGINTTEGFIKNCSELEIFKPFKSKNPVSKKVSEITIYLPLHSLLSLDDMEYMTKQLKSIIKQSI